MNIPLTKDAQGNTEPSLHDRGMISSVSDGAQLCVQTIIGVDEANNLLMTQWERFSSVVMGQTFGTDWSEWTKTA